jgi:hypothetical protein
MNKISCDIIKDILPLYYDNVCSDDSKKMVEEHLAECNTCKSELDKIKTDIKIPKETIEKNISDSNAIKNISDFWNRSKVKAFIKGVIITAISFTVIFLGYIGLFQCNIVSVPTDVVEITNVCQLADGRIVYHVKLTDGYELRRIKFNMEESGKFYESPYRPIIKSKSNIDIGLNNSYYLFGEVQQSVYKDKYGEDAEIKALYFGTQEDNILVWEEGMDLPKASEEIEKMFDYK